ncbi:hypothetical protein EfmAA96_13250 [Enterococcus faecium]|nr:hypothetical protein EfmAA96_13250 [Enterococcus faecium]
MLSPEKIERINELARKKKENGLSKAEEQEQINLRKEYLEAFRSGRDARSWFRRYLC